jgi:hypothetical protein
MLLIPMVKIMRYGIYKLIFNSHAIIYNGEECKQRLVTMFFFYVAPVAVPQIVDVRTLSSRKVEVKWEVSSQYTVISAQTGHMWHQHFDRNGQIF